MSEQCKEIEENNRSGKTNNFFKKLGVIIGTFLAMMGMIQQRNGKDLTEAEGSQKRWQEHTEELHKNVS